MRVPAARDRQVPLYYIVIEIPAWGQTAVVIQLWVLPGLRHTPRYWPRGLHYRCYRFVLVFDHAWGRHFSVDDVLRCPRVPICFTDLLLNRYVRSDMQLISVVRPGM